MADEGFVIEGRTYPFPTSFRLCDPVLVSQLTGMSWSEFVELLEDSERQDPATMAGMVGVAVWQGNPRWTRERVVRFVEQLDMDSVNVEVEESAHPPVEAEASVSSPVPSSLAPSSLSEPTSTRPLLGNRCRTLLPRDLSRRHEAFVSASVSGCAGVP